MHFEKSIEIEASQQRVWEVLTDLEAWPKQIEKGPKVAEVPVILPSGKEKIQEIFNDTVIGFNKFDKEAVRITIEEPTFYNSEVLTDLEAWPKRIETVDAVELLTTPPMAVGSRVRLRQPKLPEGTWDITTWDAPAFFEWTQKETGATIVAGHRVEALGDGRARLTLTVDMRGLLVPIMGLFSKGLTNRYMNVEAEGMKRAAEST